MLPDMLGTNAAFSVARFASALCTSSSASIIRGLFLSARSIAELRDVCAVTAGAERNRTVTISSAVNLKTDWDLDVAMLILQATASSDSIEEGRTANRLIVRDSLSYSWGRIARC